MKPGCTPFQTVGPFFSFALTANHELGRLAGPNAEGERIYLRFHVFDGDGRPVPDAMIELWQANAKGLYNESDFAGFGRLGTDENGECTFETVRPGTTPAAYVNVSFFARGLLTRLCTRVYFADDPGLDKDPVLALVPEDRRDTLIAGVDPDSPGTWNFQIRLQGESETVFFDI
jgi:protocatechuate 3,4-dioxygenase alpha subunit